MIMNICIITPYDSANYGAYLQAFATMKFLTLRGHNVFFLKWRNEKERKKIFFGENITVKRTLRNLVNYKHNHLNYSVMTKSLSAFKCITSKEATHMDAFIIGSDEVWNINVRSFQKGCFYGLLGNVNRCYAYAPSAGNSTYDDFVKFPDYAAALKKIKIIGVRDENTAKLIEDIAKYKPDVVIDPTCLISLGDYGIPKKRIVKEKYILIYSYFVTDKYRVWLKHYANENNYLLVSACMKQTWCDINICCAPLEFCGLVRDAECVFTTTFHGTIFTLLYHKKCAIDPKSKKLLDLLKWSGMLSQSCSENMVYKEFCEILGRLPCYNLFDCELTKRKSNSIELYIEALENRNE